VVVRAKETRWRAKAEANTGTGTQKTLADENSPAVKPFTPTSFQ
jgi:hypothetical protein